MKQTSNDPVPAIAEAQADGQNAVIFADIRTTLGVEVVNLIWRHLATMPGALEWAWSEAKPLYQGTAIAEADAIRRALALPRAPAFSEDTLSAAGIDHAARTAIRAILDSYDHTNALALVVLSSLLARYDQRGKGSAGSGTVLRHAGTVSSSPIAAKLPRLTPLSELSPPVAALVEELNGFGEDKDFALVASMYRHLSHWPAYLALVRTMLAPLQANSELRSLVDGARRAGRVHGAALSPHLIGSPPPAAHADAAIAAIRRFVEHPIARMTGICALIRRATPL